MTFDLLSFLIGLAVGVALAVALRRVLPHLRQLRDRSLSRVRETRAWVRAGVEKRFQVETATYVERYHLGGRWATLDQIFVMPRLLAALPEAAPDAPAGPATVALNRVWPALAAGVAAPPQPGMRVRRLLLNGRRVILSAAPGAGKTTLLAYCAHLCAHASDSGAYTFLLPLIPIFVHVAELELAQAVGDPAGPLAHALQRRAGPLTAPGVADLLRQKLVAGHGLLLLDGWDELPPAQRPAVTAWLEALLGQFPETQAIVAAPLQGYRPLLDLDFTLSGLLPWRVGRAEELGALWAAALDLPATPRLDHYWQPGRAPLSATLYLLQRALADGGTPPVRDMELMQETLPLFRPEEEGAPAWLAPAGRELWRALAHAMLAGEKVSLAPAEVQGHASTLLIARGIDPNQAQRLQKSIGNSGLFRQWPDGSVSFLNPLWRDYLAAAYLAQKEAHAEALEHLDDPRWAGALRFYVGLAGEQGLTQRLLDPRSTDPVRDSLFQVATWLPEADGGEWRRQALIQLGQLVVKPGVPQLLRQRAVAALAQTEETGVLALLRQLLQRSDPELRQAAVAALARFSAEVAVPLLERMLKDEDGATRLAVVHALAWLHDPAAEQPLLTTLLGRDEVLAQAVAEALALNGGEGWEILREAAEDDALRVRRAATFGLALLDEYWAVALLEKMGLEDEEWMVQSAANLALEAVAERNRPGAWTPQQAGDLSWLINWAARQEQLVPGGEAAAPVLLDLLREGPRVEVRVAAARSLAQVKLPAASVAEVQEALRVASRQDGEEQVREAAFAAWATLRRAYGGMA